METWIKDIIVQPIIAYYTLQMNQMDFETNKAGLVRYIKQIEALMNFVDGINDKKRK